MIPLAPLSSSLLSWLSAVGPCRIGSEYIWPASVAIDPLTPSTVYVGAAWGDVYNPSFGGIYKSVNRGLTWTQYPEMREATFFHLEIDPVTPSTLYAIVQNGVVFKSFDGGVSWPTGADLMWVNCLAIDPVTPTTLYAGMAQGIGVYKSTDGGVHWSEFNDGLTTYQERNILTLAVDRKDPSRVYVGTFGAGVLVTGPADPPQWAFKTYLPLSLLGR